MGVNVGIDLGTTYSCVSYRTSDGKFHFVKDESGANLIPSVVCFADETYVGREAVENEENNPGVTIRSAKRHIGTQTELLEGITATKVATEVLTYLSTLTQSQLNDDIDGIVITVPAYFNQNQRLQTKVAAELANLNVLRIINEPTAAALAYGEETQLNEIVLVYDLGGGTFDVTLLQLSDDNVYQVLSTDGNTSLGGDDFDQLISENFRESLPDGFKPFRDFNVRLKKFSEEVKIQLNYKQVVKKTLKYSGTVNGTIYHHDFCLSQDQYKTMITQLLLKTKSNVLNALNEANTKISGLSKIILVGGSTKSKFVREFVEKEFNTKIYYDIDPDLTVASGAANLADAIAQKNSDSAILIDVTPLSLGIETKGGLLNKIIPRNTVIPISAGQDFITAEDNQTSVNIRIFQGERPLAKDNEFLGEFELSGFEERPRGQTKIVVKFDLDASGLITVTAFDKISGIQSEVTLKPLSSQTINNLMDDIEWNAKADKEILENIELENLRKEAKTLIFSNKMKGEDEDLDAIYESVKDDISAIKVFILSLK